MSLAKTVDVLIVGAGPTGLTLAYQLRRLGASFRIIDKSPARPLLRRPSACNTACRRC